MKKVTDEVSGQTSLIEMDKRVKMWWFTNTDTKRVAVQLFYGNKVIDLAKGKNAVEVANAEEDGVDNSGMDHSALYTQPEDVAYAYEVLSKVSHRFTIAASFGNVHGVYKPGNVKLQPVILKNSQEFIKEKYSLAAEKPINFVFHGGSGSSREEIREALSYGAIKMNIDTDTQWAFWEGILNFYEVNEGYLQGQIGNPTGDDAPNKKYYDPRVWLRKGEETLITRLKTAFEDLNATNANQYL